MEIVINPRYNSLADFVKVIPETFEGITEIIQNFRNDIRRCDAGSHTVVIKCFKGMYIPNQLAYSLFRKSKAQRSYETSVKLLARGFNVPDPIAYVDCYQYGFLTQSYFVSLYHGHTNLNDGLKDVFNRTGLLLSLAEFTFVLHQSKVYHGDYSNGNIFCNGNGNQVRFALTDLNRVTFGRVSFLRGVRNFAKLSMPDECLKILVDRYAELHGCKTGNEFEYLVQLRARRNNLIKWRKRFKAVFFPWRVRPLATAAREV